MKATWMLLIILFTSISHAGERYEFYNGTRQMAMGGVTVSTVNDETALIVNPSALGKLRSSYITIFDPEVSSGAANAGIIKTGGASTSFLDPQKLLGQLQNKPDTHMHFMTQLFPSFVTTNFGIGVHAKYRYNAELDSDQNLYRYNYLNDIALVTGFNLRLWDGRIKFGFNGRFINRVEVDRESDTDALPASSTGLAIKDIAREGMGVGGDVSMTLTAPWTWLPSLAAVWRDAGGTSYNLNDGFLLTTGQRPHMTPQSVDVGLSVSPILGKRMRAQFAAEYQDVMTYSKETSQLRRLHAGMELNFADMVFIRGGMNQKYWTAGFEFSMHLFQIQLTSYGEDIGTASSSREDRRYMGKFSFRF